MSVVIVSAETGWTARAKPAASDVTTNSRRVNSTFPSRLSMSSCIGRLPPRMMKLWADSFGS